MANEFKTAFGPQPDPLDQGPEPNRSKIIGTVGVASAFTAGGFAKLRSNRGWDHYSATIKAVESLSPGGILRTFRVSETLSPLERWQQLSLNRKQIEEAGYYGQFLRKTFGGQNKLTLETPVGAMGVFGNVVDDKGKVLGIGVSVEPSGVRGSSLADYYARIKGVPLGRTDSLVEDYLRSQHMLSGSRLPYNVWKAEQQVAEAYGPRLIVGARLRENIKFLGQKIILSERISRNLARAEIATNLFRARAAVSIGRLNILLANPSEVPIIGSVLSKVPGLKALSIKPGPALTMMGRFATKATAIGLGLHGLEYLDYLRSSGSMAAAPLSVAAGGVLGALLAKAPGAKFSRTGAIVGAGIGLFTALAPRFDEGLFYGAATIPADLNVARAKASQSIGLTEDLKKQEELTPGLISPYAAIGFAGFGGLAASTAGYAGFLKDVGKEKIKSTLGWGENRFFKIAQNIRTGNQEKLAKSIWTSPIGQKILKTPVLNKLGGIKTPFALGAVAGLIGWQAIVSGLSIMSGNYKAAIPGAALLGAKETPEELKAIYSGEQEIPVRKGRFWEFNREEYEGGREEYYRVHSLERLRTRAYEKGIYGSDEERWKYDPVLHPLKALFGSDEWKYHYDTKNQRERPATQTSTYFENVPLLGPLLASTVGEAIKPRKLIRPEEWQTPGGGFVYRATKPELEPSNELEGEIPGAPVEKSDAAQLFNELNYRKREASGLVGWMGSVETKGLLGREEIFKNQQTLSTAGYEQSSEYWLFKHMNLGGAAGVSESVRRFVPRTRSYLDEYNPLENTLADISWMPKDYFIDITHGNKFKKIPEAEIRTPGPGFESLNPEVKGLDPEDYPLAYRAKILGDIAPYSKEYKDTMRQARKEMSSMSLKQRAIVSNTSRQVRAKKKRQTFDNYVFSGDQLVTEEVTVKDVLSPRLFRTEELGDMVVQIQGLGAIRKKEKAQQRVEELIKGKTISVYTPAMESRKYDLATAYPRMKAAPVVNGKFIGDILEEEGLAKAAKFKNEFKRLDYSGREQLSGKLGEFISHGMDTPLEYLTPFAPISKFVHQRSAIEEYAQSEVYGTKNAFWDKPIENFISPMVTSAIHRAGVKAIPEENEKKREINEYFDMLKWTKFARLEAKARSEGDIKSSLAYRDEKKSTLFGANVFGNVSQAVRALPRKERDYFSAFAGAKTEEERQQILELVPENEKRLYQAQWMAREQETAKAKAIAGIENEEDMRVIETATQMRQSNAIPYTTDEQKQWAKETGGNITFDDWLRDKMAKKYFETHSLPDKSWVGFNPAVDLDDVKMVYAETAGIDFHDLDLWDDRKRMLSRKPYINPTLVSEMKDRSKYEESWKMFKNAKTINAKHTKDNRLLNIQYNKVNAEIGRNRYNIEVRDKRDKLIKDAHKQLGV